MAEKGFVVTFGFFCHSNNAINVIDLSLVHDTLVCTSKQIS